MKRLLILLPIMMLQGCLWQSVSATDIYYAEKFCEEKESKLDYISEYFHGGSDIMCENGENSILRHYTRTLLERGVKSE